VCSFLCDFAKRHSFRLEIGLADCGKMVYNLTENGD
jgi:hypothetical protein